METVKKTALEIVKYEVHGGISGAPLNHKRFRKPKTSRGLS